MSHDITHSVKSEPHDDSEDVRSWAGDFDPLADAEERRVLFAALDSFRQYRRTAHMNTTHRRRQAFYALPSAHWQMLAEPPFSILENFNRVDDAIDMNAEIADAILATGLSSFGLSPDPNPEDPRENWHGTANTSDVNKAHSTLRQFYRDWSAEGRAEREVCYDPVLQDLRTEFGARAAAGQEIRVLVPGAGLGRLVFDIARAGFSPEGNEISYHQLLASSWVLNHTLGPQKHTLYPFALHFSNLLSREQQLQTVMIPDQHPGTVMAEAPGNPEGPPFGQMSMSAADFVVLYRQPDNREAFDAVATVFFIDTAPNLIRYIETIHHCLKPNGLWINVGPLLWHFEDGANRSHENSHDSQDQGISEPGNVELTEAEVLCLVERMGFVIEQRQPAHERPWCGYIQDPNSMLLPLYRPSHWVARKKSH
ncbi:N2227-domain-containing protein [Aspergillus indologenus CBS 114.80]|uniref:carnosine N-methyltransferase n=1 Tax=Aspergillus indologenus CBS 114.80 TaxID=1450541 RepID=A0A2V5HR99_9EURO|nr:N2227-domain-containing protein [Aspergillus indologenus CBS 114.80]